LVLTDKTYDERALLSRVSKGDEAAFTLLLNKHTNNLYSQALAYTKSSEVAQDIVQDVFMKIWMKRKELTSIERFENYLFIMTRNRIISILRKKLTLPVSDGMQELIEENSPTPEQQFSLKQAESILEKGILAMPPQRQMVFKLSRKEGLSYAEIAEELGISTSTVKSHIVQALNFLRDYLRLHGEPLITLALILFLQKFRNF
jgi:RNA polymerase sigma-70 factor (family 1)